MIIADKGKKQTIQADFERTFDLAALDYDISRPGYPEELYRDLFAYKEIGPNGCALEIGAGTGKATGLILDTGCSVTALEPGRNLAAIAEARFAGRKNFRLCSQRMQEFECCDGTFDLIYAATAFHWIPEAYGYPRVYRLLRRGGAFARFAYHAGPDASRPELAKEIQAAYERCPGFGGKGKSYGDAEAGTLSEIAKRYGFVDTTYRVYRQTKDFTAEEYMKLLRTYPDHMALEQPNRERLFASIREAIVRHGGVITVHYVVDMQMARKP